MTATVCPTNATNKCVRWSSSNNGVAMVNPDSGYVTAQGAGTAIITATAQDGSGKYAECRVTVNRPVAVADIEVCPTSLTMNVGDVEYLCTTIIPYNATNQSVTWCSSNENVATVGIHSGRITAKRAGTATITATTADGGYQANCTLTVIIDTVTIKKDGAFNKVVFNKTGKVWRCINRDMIFDEDNMNNTFLIQRSNHNFFTYYNENDPLMSNTTPKEYTDDEIKLLYAIDPYGVANYVQRYASELFYVNELESVLGYKDRIFKLLFKRDPKYFARALDGSTWYETNDKSNLSAVQSESESVFGMHPIWDDYTLLQVIEAIGTMVSIAITITCTAPKVAEFIKGHKTVKYIVKFFSFLSNSVGSGFISASAGEFLEKAFVDTELSWAYDMVSLYSSLQELVTDFDTGDNYYKQIFEHCTNDLDYDIYVELKSGEKCKLKKISEMMTD